MQSISQVMLDNPLSLYHPVLLTVNLDRTCQIWEIG
jgi:hypothetical protein